MQNEKIENVYMQKALAEQQDVARELQIKRARKVVLPQPDTKAADRQTSTASSNDSCSHYLNDVIGIRITGFWRWKTVIVPPNMYVVHTRRGYTKPLHIGLGLSFRFDPTRDSFLVVPSTMQTIVINANCICKELQGILVQAYVQWIIKDINIAFQRLDFSDLEDPMRVVNVQLREQAEAAIKDKVATMSIHDVLSDKQPIIEELTARLRQVAEGSGDDQGLGLKIVTVQIKEAIVSSARTWEDLQKPFRTEKRRVARLAELENNSLIKARELEEREKSTKAEVETQAVLDQLEHEKQAEAFNRAQAEANRRHQLEQEAEQQRLLHEKATEQARLDMQLELKEKELQNAHRLALAEKEAQFDKAKQEILLAIEVCKETQAKIKAQAELAALRITKQSELSEQRLQAHLKQKSLQREADLAAYQQRCQARNAQMEKELEFARARRKISNMLSSEHVQMKALEMLPALAKELPTPEHLHTISVNGTGPGANFTALTAGIVAMLKNYGIDLEKNSSARAQE